MLCDTCIGVLQHRRHVIQEDFSGDYVKFVKCAHHLTYASLARSVEDGCQICRPVWDCLLGTEQDSLRVARTGTCRTEEVASKEDDLRTNSITHFSLTCFTHQSDLCGDIYFNQDSIRNRHRPRGEFVFERETNHSGYRIGQITSDCTFSDESLQRASQWLKDCSTTHVKCNADSRRSWYSTRLLYSGDPDNDGAYMRLVHTAKEPPIGPYATLSHRWGNTRPLQLTRSMTLDPRPTLLVADMPKTFQDAVQVCKRLGVMYLWIDSLCIIQDKDDLLDWYHEAGFMDKVYLHSYCNISATDASDSTKGLFRSRDAHDVSRVSVQVYLGDFDPDTEFSRCTMHDDYLWDHNVRKSPLNKRGWVFQERLLAPRVLHFCRDQLFWECRKLSACESYPAGLTSSQLTLSGHIGKSWNPEDKGTTWYTFWDEVVIRDYSGMDLTVPGDKLVALSGIAKFIRPLVNATYVAGMWLEDLETTLAWWVVEDPEHPSSRPVEYRAPSWSWASIDGKVICPHDEENEILVTVEDVNLQHATEDTTGVVTGGWLDLRGSLKPLKLYGETTQIGIKWYMVVGGGLVCENKSHPLFTSRSVRHDVAPNDKSAFDEDSAEKRLFFMPCRKTSISISLHCLLVKIVDIEKKTFERFGVVMCDLYEGQELLEAELDEETKASLPCLRYENGLHTIRII